jgi:hypothetical protein
MLDTVICRFCGDEFTPAPNKPGLRNVCYNAACVQAGEKLRPEVVLMGGNMIYDHKTAPELVIRQDIMEAKRWARLERRSNASSPLTSILQGREPISGANYSKQDSGAEAHAMYYSPLGEKRHVKG